MAERATVAAKAVEAAGAIQTMQAMAESLERRLGEEAMDGAKTLKGRLG